VLTVSSVEEVWEGIGVLIVDEISMCQGQYFDLLDRVLRRVRMRPNVTLGGVRLIAAGDMLQLPPIGEDAKFVFESDAWAAMAPATLRLVHPHRHPDARFVELLGRARRACLTSEDVLLLRSRVLQPPMGPATRFFATNAQVEALNNERLGRLKGSMRLYAADEEVLDPIPADVVARMQALGRTVPKSDGAKGLEDVQAPAMLRLKVGAEVMHLVNREGLVNGDRGVVVAMGEATVTVLFRRLKEAREIQPHLWEIHNRRHRLIAWRSQLPLRLAWARPPGAHLSQLTAVGPHLSQGTGPERHGPARHEPRPRHFRRGPGLCRPVARLHALPAVPARARPARLSGQSTRPRL